MGLKQISPTLCSYKFLTVLYMNHNNLTKLTSDIAKLVNLRTLDCSGNKLSTLPPELGMLVNLRDLLLFDNNLTSLPNELGMLYQLEMLGLEGNPIQSDIKNILMKEGTQAVIMSLRENAPGRFTL
jgi:CCR4-NOT transcription complex subunit 6